MLEILGYTTEDICTGKTKEITGKVHAKKDIEALAGKTGIGVYTLSDILTELEKPGRDPRSSVQGAQLRKDVLSMEDLKPGMELSGTVRNIVDFGVFVDIGVHQDGLVHISALSDHYVKHPLDVVKVGQIVKVRVLAVDPAKHRISLTMKGVPQD